MRTIRDQVRLAELLSKVTEEDIETDFTAGGGFDREIILTPEASEILQDALVEDDLRIEERVMERDERNKGNGKTLEEGILEILKERPKGSISFNKDLTLSSLDHYIQEDC